MDAETALNLVQKHLNELGEHFDSVQIFATEHKGGDEGGTASISMGTGNWFARYGQVMEWVIKKEHECRLDMER